MNTRFFIQLITLLIFTTPLLTASNKLVIISDEEGLECPISGDDSNALAEDLEYFIKEDTAPILVSKSVLHRFVVDKEAEAAEDSSIACPRNIMRIFKVLKSKTEATSYYLIIPFKFYTRRRNAALRIESRYGAESAAKITFGFNFANLPTLRCNDWTTLATVLAHDRTTTGFASEFLHDFFLQRKHLESTPELIQFLKPWSIMMSAHGSEGSISGLTIETLQKFFNFLSNELETKVVAMTSCFLGGATKNNLCTDSQGKQISYNFDFIVAGLSDVSASLNSSEQGLARQFFALYQSQQKVNPVEAIALYTRLNIPYCSAHPALGQIRLARTTKFIVPANTPGITKLTPGKEFSDRTKAIALAAEGNQVKQMPTPLKLTNDVEALLLYKPTYQRPLEVSLSTSSQQISPIICADYYLQLFMDTIKEPATAQLYPAITAAQNTIGPKPTTSSYEVFTQEIKNLYCPANFRYPCFIPMKHDISLAPETPKPTVYLFDEITIKKHLNSPFIGILRFIRDSYLCGGSDESASTICIKKLRGNNDLSLLFECMDIEIEDDSNTELQKTLKENDLIGKEIELTNVIIEKSQGENPRYSVSFFIKKNKAAQIKTKDTAWKSDPITPDYSENDLALWMFSNAGTRTHNKKFNDLAAQATATQAEMDQYTRAIQSFSCI